MRKILPELEDKPDGTEPADAGKTSDKLECLLVAFFAIEGTESFSQGQPMDPQLFQLAKQDIKACPQRLGYVQVLEATKVISSPVLLHGTLYAVEVEELANPVRVRMISFWMAIRVRLICRSSLLSLSGT